MICTLPGIKHIWQLLMVGQLPAILYFATTWIRGTHRATVLALALQIGAMAAAAAPVFLLHW